MKRKIIITGGLGYLGSELCKIYSGFSWYNEVVVIDKRFISKNLLFLCEIYLPHPHLPKKAISMTLIHRMDKNFTYGLFPNTFSWLKYYNTKILDKIKYQSWRIVSYQGRSVINTDGVGRLYRIRYMNRYGYTIYEPVLISQIFSL